LEIMRRNHLAATLALASVALVGACADNGTAPAAAPAFGAPTAREVSMDPALIRIGDFSKSPVIAMAQKHGWFADANLTVTEEQTPSSPVIFQKLRDGQWDVILTQIDNVFNYRYNQSNPLGGTFEPVAFLGTDNGNGASLMARPEFTSVEQLRGKTVAVDSKNSGFAFVLYGIMRAHGLEKDVDYTVVVPAPSSGTPARYAGLVAGKFDATILNAGYQFQAAAAGMQTLGGIRDAADPFMGGSGVALRSWLDANPDVAIRFIRAYVAAQRYTLDPANKDEILAWLTAEAKGNVSVAEQTYQILVTPGDGLIPDGQIDVPGLFGTASLRDSFGGFDEPQNLRVLTSPASGMYDLSYWQRAVLSNGWTTK
jgi:ABC-type nitrate/sulfonate/bicarbonate transport system substrate-binding protein